MQNSLHNKFKKVFPTPFSSINENWLAYNLFRPKLLFGALEYVFRFLIKVNRKSI